MGLLDCLGGLPVVTQSPSVICHRDPKNRKKKEIEEKGQCIYLFVWDTVSLSFYGILLSTLFPGLLSCFFFKMAVCEF